MLTADAGGSGVSEAGPHAASAQVTASNEETSSPLRTWISLKDPCPKSGSCREDHPAFSEEGEHVVELVLPDRKAARGAAELAMGPDHLFVGVPGAVDDHRAIQRVAVGGVEGPISRCDRPCLPT
ncbi:hypothetical protein Ddc_23599 [Ditylenchus destructor]|nr:hypothetical protein Ddc_23599 [Ditylenchus destructor]